MDEQYLLPLDRNQLEIDEVNKFQPDMLSNPVVDMQQVLVIIYPLGITDF